ncbi:hypothetical protein ACVOMS_28860 [Bradyrhizobium guangxiense]
MDRRDLLRAAAALPLSRVVVPDTAFAQFVATGSARLIATLRKIGKVE